MISPYIIPQQQQQQQQQGLDDHLLGEEAAAQHHCSDGGGAATAHGSGGPPGAGPLTPAASSHSSQQAEESAAGVPAAAAARGPAADDRCGGGALVLRPPDDRATMAPADPQLAASPRPAAAAAPPLLQQRRLLGSGGGGAAAAVRGLATSLQLPRAASDDGDSSLPQRPQGPLLKPAGGPPAAAGAANAPAGPHGAAARAQPPQQQQQQQPLLHQHEQQQQQRQHEQQQSEQEQPTDSEDDSWTPGQPQSSGENENEVADEGESWDPLGLPPRCCTNCTARLYGLCGECGDCGHSSEQDASLFDGASGPAAAGVQQLQQQQQERPEGSVQRPLIIWDDEMLLHEEGKAVPHPERPDRLRAIMARLMGNGLTGACQRVPARLATKAELLRVHTAEHLHRLQLFCSGSLPATSIPSDTYINQHTLHCAALAAGSAAEAAVRVARGEAACGAAIIRPPGHHAESNTAMGFCLLNNAAVAARAAQAAGAARVVVLDWDVHHGNGTQHIFEDDPTVLYVSLHRYDRGNFYPGTGAADEVGLGRGAGYTLNVPWDAGGMRDGDYMAAMRQVVLPILREFAPDITIISAGFDAAEGDPIGGCRLTPGCFAAMTAALLPLAPAVLLLEGGYNLAATAASTEACLRVLLGEAPAPVDERPSAFGWLAAQAARKAHGRYWSCLAGALPQQPQQLQGQPSLQQQLRLLGADGYGCAWASDDDGGGSGGASQWEEDEGDEEEEAGGRGGGEALAAGAGAASRRGAAPQAAAGNGADEWFGLGDYYSRLSHDGAHASSFRQSCVGGLSRGSAALAPAAAAARGEQRRRALRRVLAWGVSRKQQVLRAISRKAMKVVWARRLRQAQQRQQQPPPPQQQGGDPMVEV